MTSAIAFLDSGRYARCIEASKRVRWEIERDVIRGRRFDYGKAFMPAGLSLLGELEFLSPSDQRLLSQVQPDERAAAVGDFLELVGAVDGVLQAQAAADAKYFIGIAGAKFDRAQCERIEQGVRKAYRWQYIVSGATDPRFQKILFGMLDAAQVERIAGALAPLAYAVPAPVLAAAA